MIKKQLLLLLVLTRFAAVSQDFKIDSLRNVIKNGKTDTTLARAYVALSEQYAGSDFDTMIVLCSKAIELANKNNSASNELEKETSLSLKGSAYNNSGFAYLSKGQFDKALEFFLNAAELFELLDDQVNLGSALNNAGYVYNKQGLIEKCLEFYQRALRAREKAGDKKGVANSLNNLASVYEGQGEIKKALANYEQAAKIYRLENEKSGLSSALNNIGKLYLFNGGRSKSLGYFEEALALSKEVKNRDNAATFLMNIGAYYREEGEALSLTDTAKHGLYIRALQYFQESYRISEEIGQKQSICFILNNIGGMYRRLADIEKNPALKNQLFRKAEENSLRSLLLAQKMGYVSAQSFASQTLSRVYSSLGDYKKAFDMHVLFKKMSDSLSNQATQKAAVKKQMQYEYEKKEAQRLAEQEIKNSVAKKELEREKAVRNGFVAGFVLVGVLGIVIFRGYRNKQAANKALEEKNQLIESQKSLVEEKQKEILDSIKYARRIQTALLPTEKFFEKNLERVKNR